MADLQMVWDADNGRCDLVFAAPDLVTGGDLETAVLISLFTDRTADPADVIPDGSTDPRGWWGDEFADRPIGSKLWLLERAKGGPELPKRVRDYIADALKWLTDDKVCASVDVAAAWISPSAIGAVITLHRQGQPPVVLNYPNVWAGVS
jgi:phage gp46-like protein